LQAKESSETIHKWHSITHSYKEKGLTHKRQAFFIIA